MADFPTQVNVQPAPAVEGDFASANPRATVLAGPGGLVAGPNGVTVGRFAWLAAFPADPNGTGQFVSNTGFGPVAGFVHREQQGLITAFLAASSMLVPAGFPITLFSSGDFWVKNAGAVEAIVGQKCYANFADGKATFAATGAPTNIGTSTSSTIAQSTFSVTGSIANDIMTVTAVGSGTVVPGATISGTGILTGTQVVGQILPLAVGETAGGIGRYGVTVSELTVASTTISGTYGTLTVGGSITGTFNVGDTVTGSGLAAGTAITALGTGVGGAGTYIVNNNTLITPGQTINASQNVETKWIAMSGGLTGELVKISAWPLG